MISKTDPPITDDFLADVRVEADYQTAYWGDKHDDGKTDTDWFWTLSYIVGKVLRPDATLDKRRHRLRAAAALLMQWDRRIK